MNTISVYREITSPRAHLLASSSFLLWFLHPSLPPSLDPFLLHPSLLPPQDRSDLEADKVKSTLILCYGQVALNAPPEHILKRIDQDILRLISKHFSTKVTAPRVRGQLAEALRNAHSLSLSLTLLSSVLSLNKGIPPWDFTNDNMTSTFLCHSTFDPVMSHKVFLFDNLQRIVAVKSCKCC